VAPLRVARGVQNKVLEAMAMALPVVATTRAHEGLDARPGQHLFVEDDPSAFADLTARLLRDADLRATVGTAARAFVERQHAWPAIMTKVDQVVAEVTGRRVAPATLEAVRR
jgi:glycosyltransferase involved in cell wall biosynthesis